MSRAGEYYESYWTQGLGAWSPLGVSPSAFEQRFLTRYLRPGCRVLDFGCGDGAHVGPWVRASGASYVGVDVSEAAVVLCRQRGLDALVTEPGKPLAFQDDAFDLVVSFEALEHLFAPAEALAECIRVLCKGGTMLGSVPNVVFLGNRVLMVLGFFSPGGSPATSLKMPWADPHIRFFSRATLERLLRATGFADVRVVGAGFSLAQLPVLYRAPAFFRSVLDVISLPLRPLGKAWCSLFSVRLYFVATK